jgi:hypothetical protein
MLREPRIKAELTAILLQVLLSIGSTPSARYPVGKPGSDARATPTRVETKLTNRKLIRTRSLEYLEGWIRIITKYSSAKATIATGSKRTPNTYMAIGAAKIRFAKNNPDVIIIANLVRTGWEKCRYFKANAPAQQRARA